MKTRLLAFAAALILIAPSAFGQIEVIGRAAWIDTDAHEDLEDDPDMNRVRMEVDSDSGYGLAFNFYVGDQFSVELGASVFEPDVIITETQDISGVLINRTGIEVVPLTAVLQYHFRPEGPFDVYVGAGAAYVILDDIGGLDDAEVDSIELDEDAGFAVNLGINWLFSDAVALNVDAKYVPLESAATVVFPDRTGEPRDVSINPLIVSAGLAVRF